MGIRTTLSLLILLGISACENSAPQKSPDHELASQKPDPVDHGTKVKSYDGPFGLAMGEPVNELDLADGGDASQARVLKSVPKPSPDIETYAVVAYPGAGICEIRAVGKSFDSDAYGNNVKAAIDAMAESLDSKYGSHRKINDCSESSCQFFQQGLNEGTAAYYYEWSKAHGSAIEPSIKDITLIAMAGQFNGTYWRLDYTSSDVSNCKTAKAKLKSASL